MSRHGLVSLVSWCLFGLYVTLCFSSTFQLLSHLGAFGDPAALGLSVPQDWFSKAAKAAGLAFHSVASTAMVAFGLLLHRGRRLAHRIVLVVPWLVIGYSVLGWLAGRLHGVLQGEAFMPLANDPVYVAFLLTALFGMFLVAFLNSWVVTSESVVRWIEVEDASRRAGGNG